MRTIRSTLLFLALYLVTDGRLSSYALDRFNHFHSENNARIAGSVSTNLAGIRSSRSGTDLVLLGNLDAQLGLMTTVGDKLLTLEETSTILRTLDETTSWADLDRQVYASWGLDNPAPALAQERLQERTLLVLAVGKVLETLSQAQAALAKSAAIRAKSAVDSLGGSHTVAATAEWTNTTWLELVKEFNDDVIAAGRLFRNNALTNLQLTALQERILREAESSRDPASAYALAAAIGAGLRNEDIAALRSFLKHLESRLRAREAARQRTPASNDKTNLNPLAPFRMERLSARSELSTSAVPAAPAPFLDGVNPVAEPFLQSLSHTYVLVIAASGDKDDLSLQLFNDPTKNAITEVRSNRALAGVTLANTATNLISLAKKISASADSIDTNLKPLRSLLDDTNKLQNISAALGSTNGFDAFLNLLKIDPKLNKELQGEVPLSADQIKYLKGIFNDIMAEATAARQRLVQFFIDLTSTEQMLYAENGRHYSALATIAAKELRRWEWLNQVHQRSVELSRAAYGPQNSTGFLFMTAQEAAGYNSRYQNALSDTNHQAFARGFDIQNWRGASIAPQVRRDDPVLPTLRLLAEHAGEFQRGSPAAKDPLGYYSRLGNSRLRNAVWLTKAAIFMQDYNRRQAEILNRLLLREIKEHAIHLDGIVLRVLEADINLQIGDSVAFHSSGINQSDLQFIISTIQTGLVGWIGAKQ